MHLLLKQRVYVPLDKMNPLIAVMASSANDPNVFATIMFLPKAPISLKSPEAI